MRGGSTTCRNRDWRQQRQHRQEQQRRLFAGNIIRVKIIGVLPNEQNYYVILYYYIIVLYNILFKKTNKNLLV